ncbi:SAM-dependent DNA methyltransferase [Euhalothece natronophila Z-M001]|uniref:site-specific DNA-methyltransferase (adenine-specific) n=1 Tax=Euhalothece natronophila Z-M001 TaxID=522448 RepID=A0A5B8NLC5_9CHRO|nr:class I SAM-dependent DNA methyltransferase [Euhalothece natronophila]QDZ39816.1 SAM-dependent DNA methyltransferase [Euhalothece natronophila Z-M001]
MITGELKSKVDRLWETFWSNGISNPLSVIEQISYLLFIKQLDDKELAKEKKARRLNRPVKDPLFPEDKQHCRWSHFKNLDDPEKMLEVVREDVFPFIKQLKGSEQESNYSRYMKDATFLISSPALLANAVEQIDQMLADLEQQARTAQHSNYVDLMGDLYEYMLSKLTNSGQNGQFRTPRHIIRMMVELVDPGPGEIICDPACGTGGFLVSAADYVKNKKDAEGNHLINIPENREHYQQGMFYGYDFDATMLRIGSMNMILHGIEGSKIESCDSLSQNRSEISESFSLILANPPFKGSVEKSTIAKDLTKIVSTTKTELLFLALFLRLLKVGGRAAVIVPDGVLFGSQKAYQTIRKTIVEDHKLEGLIAMPSGVFKPYAGVSTAVLIFTKTNAGGTDNVWFYQMKADGLSLDDKRQPVEENDIPDIVQRWKNRDPEKDSNRTGKAFFVPKDEIKDNNYDLSINRYKEIEYEEVEYEPPKVILRKLQDLENDIQQDLDALENLIK